MKRLLVILPIALSLGIPSGALASEFYRGPIEPGAFDELIEVTVKFDGDRPVKVTRLRWANVPTTCTGGSSAVSGELKGKLRIRHREFAATKPVSNSNAIVQITGKFKDGDKKMVGTFRQTGPSAGCPGGDTGVLGYHAK
jgi:hypothetical protein